MTEARPRKQVNIYTDGACSGNPGPGGWGGILEFGPHRKEMSGYMAGTTNNRMELFAAISALGALKEPCDVKLYSDSAYLVNAFNEDDTNVFLISLKAGGTGLNLTGADIVIHYDPWWNTAAQNQATDRAHRIGQKNVVNVYRILAKGTIEEKIVELQERKLQLSDRILGGESLQAQSLTREELLELLR